MKECILQAVPDADLKVSQYRGQPLQVTVSFLEFDTCDPQMMACLPEGEQWRIAERRIVFQAPQMQLYRKNPEERQASIHKIVEGCHKIASEWRARLQP